LKLKAIRRWGPWLALVIVFSLATSLLSWWQFDRRQDRVAKIEMVTLNYDLEPVPLDQISWDFKDGEPVNEWRPVTVSGQYLPEQSVIVRNRPLSGRPGFLQLVPLQMSNGQILIVERGWLGAGEPLTVPESNPLPDQAQRDLVVRLRLSEQDLRRGEVEGQLASIHIASLADELGPNLITEYYGRLVIETPAMAENPRPMPKPSLNEGNHLSYALQWILFGLMAFAALIWAIRNERRLRLEAEGVLRPKVRKVTQAQRDAEIEDAQ
jgi:cytochrome oxidase assembly protein ShyY1